MNVKKNIFHLPLVSIIIPCYNAQRYLHDALKSAENQTYRNIEIICINDGSQDGTGRILRVYQQQSKRNVIVADIDNSGVSIARNRGIEESRGEFLFFLDADDCISKNCIEGLVSAYLAAGQECDIAYGCWTRYAEKLSKKLVPAIREEAFEAMNHYIFRDRPLVFTCYLYCGRLIRTKKLMFKRNIKYSEDNLFLWEYMCHVRQAAYVPMNVYYYRPNALSVTSHVSWHLTDAVKSVQMAYYYMKKNGYVNRRKIIAYLYPRMMLSVAAGYAKNGKRDLYNLFIMTYPVRKKSVCLIGKKSCFLSLASLIMWINPEIYYYLARCFWVSEKAVNCLKRI